MLEDAKKIFELVRERKWDTLIFIGMLIIVAVAVPPAVRSFVIDAVAKQFEPVVEAIDDTRMSVRSIEEYNEAALRNSAIVAYNKIQTVEDLEPLTQNGLAIREALKVPEIRSVLASIDLERTRMFERYFSGE